MNTIKDYFQKDAQGYEYAGKHLLIDLWGAKNLQDQDFVKKTLEQGASAADATILYTHIHHFGEGQGVSGVVVLAESHITIHTWPERAFAAIDIFMCGACDPRQCLPVFQKAFEPEKMVLDEMKRGEEKRKEA